jgi:hypothetical protein
MVGSDLDQDRLDLTGMGIPFWRPEEEAHSSRATVPASLKPGPSHNLVCVRSRFPPQHYMLCSALPATLWRVPSDKARSPEHQILAPHDRWIDGYYGWASELRTNNDGQCGQQRPVGNLTCT